MNLLIQYLRLNKYYLFIAIITANMLLMWLSKSVLINEVVFYNTYSEQISYDRSIEIFEGMKAYSWIGYLFLPIVFLLKFTLVSIIIYIGAFLCDLYEKITFKKVFGIVVASEIVFLFASLIKILWFCFFAGNYDLNDLNFFYPLSLGNFFNRVEVDKIWIFPLQVLNLFQIIYLLLLSYGLYIQTGVRHEKAEKAVLVSYLPGLVIWVAFIMFLTIGSSL